MKTRAAAVNLRIADLHTHSTWSDGKHAPAEVVRLAVRAGLSMLALTDHDTTRGNAEAAERCEAEGIEFVPGIEISALDGGEEYHILGYFVDGCPELDDYIEATELRRDRRLVEIVTLLAESGVAIDVEGIRRRAGGVVTRSHIAEYMVASGHVNSVRSAFERYLGPGCSAYVPSAAISVEHAIGVIHGAGGCASLAHPGEWLNERIIEVFGQMGLDAIETVHPSHDERLTDYYTSLADRFELLATGGSDFHAVSGGGSNSPGAYYVNGENVDQLRRRALQIRSGSGQAPESNE